MSTPRTSRKSVPAPAALNMHHPKAAEDFEELGWTTPETTPLRWTLAGTGDPDLARFTMVRLKEALGSDWQALNSAMSEHPALRTRLASLVGGSAVLGDHLVANPETWRVFEQPMPEAGEMFAALLGAVQATPVAATPIGEDETSDGVPDEGKPTQTEALDAPGTYRAGITGTEAEQALKSTYRTLLMRIAAHDLAGTFLDIGHAEGQPPIPVTTVTTKLTELADAALTAALAVAIATVYDDEQPDTRLAVVAMGKSGAEELNYISDVDVVFVAEPATSKATRLAGELIRIGGAAFFDVDAALRPEGKHGALVRSLESHLAYYKKWANTWEFQALLKSRPATGDMVLGTAYREAVEPMVWSASQRESFVDDVQAMRVRVVDNVPDDLKNRELKLGRGGLRDVEFAVQLLQMVHGRVDETVRPRSTVEALKALSAGGYISREDAAKLSQTYQFLRLLEHRLQLQRVRRTHTMPADSEREHLRWLARATGIRKQGTETSADAVRAAFKKAGHQISGLHAKLFYRPLLHSVVHLEADTLRLTPESAKRQLAALGYEYPDRAFEHLIALASDPASRKAKIQAMLLPTLMEWLAPTADPDAGLLNYRKLSDAAYTRNWFLRMLRDEGVVGQRLMQILGNSPYTSQLIVATPDFVRLLGDGAQGPKLLDADPKAVARSLEASAARHKDPKKAIDVARSLRRTELARIASADLLGMMEVREVCRNLSSVWNAVLEAALDAEIRAATPTGDGAAEATPPATIAVIGMGRLGGAELGYGSDADVMFVCQPAEGVSEDEAVKWAIGVCDRLRANLHRPSNDPSLEVDLGLRPEGRSGAAVRTVESYRRYYEQWGEVWERQALLRAAVIAGDQATGQAFMDVVNPYRYPPEGVDQSVVREVRRMKARVDNERLPRGANRTTHTKLGRGALTDIEWTVQLLTMLHAHEIPELHTPSTLDALDVLEEHEVIAPEKVRRLRDAWLLATKTRNALVLVRGKRTDQLPDPGRPLAHVAGAAGWDPEQYQEFMDHYLKTTRRCRQVVDEVFWGETTMEH